MCKTVTRKKVGILKAKRKNLGLEPEDVGEVLN